MEVLILKSHRHSEIPKDIPPPLVKYINLKYCLVASDINQLNQAAHMHRHTRIQTSQNFGLALLFLL